MGTRCIKLSVLMTEGRGKSRGEKRINFEGERCVGSLVQKDFAFVEEDDGAAAEADDARGMGRR